jgi:polysaccharide pyruvyl transferase WcaK-like protein
MGASCPVASVSYQGKFDGLYKHFDIQGSVLSSENIKNENKIANFVEKEFKSRDETKRKIEKTKKTVKEKAKNNFNFALR